MLLAYQSPDASEFLKTAMGWNFASAELGERIMREIIDLVLSEKIKPVVGQVVGFDELPAAVDAMANRKTVGRTIVTVGS